MSFPFPTKATQNVQRCLALFFCRPSSPFVVALLAHPCRVRAVGFAAQGGQESEGSTRRGPLCLPQRRP